MTVPAPLFRPRTDSTDEISLRWNGDRRVAARAGDTVSAALLGAGIVSTSRSIKYRRHRGPYCLQGDCGTCLVRIDGLPNVRACMTSVREGMRIEPQNRLLPVGPDPTAIVDKVFVHGMDHHHLMVRPRIANLMMQEVARGLAGLGRLPEHVPERRASRRQHAPDVLVVGAGPAGAAAVASVAHRGLSVLHLDRMDRTGLPSASASEDDRLLDSAAVFGVYPDESVWAAIGRSPENEVLHLVRPKHVIIATGARSPMIPVAGNDIPGVVSARGLLALLARCNLELAVPVYVLGRGPHAETASRALETRWIDPSEVERIEGHAAVEAIRLRDRSRLPCRIVALASTPAPASDLARQAGAEVRWNGAGFAIVRDEHGRCAAAAPWGLWAAGDVCGWVGPEEAKRDGHVVGEAVARACREEV